MNLRPWKTLSKEMLLDYGRFLKVERHEVQLPNGRVIDDWSWIIIPGAAIVLAVTQNQKFICFRQTKYAVEGTSLAPVAGMIEAGEEPIDAAKRELLEETGYSTSDWVPLGSYKVDPNRGVAVMHLFLARNAQQVAEPDCDDLEDQQLLLLDREVLEAALDAGEIQVLAWTTVIALALRYLDRHTP